MNTKAAPVPRLIRMLAPLLIGLLYAAAPAMSQTSEPDALVADLDSIARAPILRGQVVGSSVAVVQGRDTLLLERYGLGSVELHVPTPRDAVYEIGSVTKQFTAAAVLKLVEDGKVELDAPISRYLPDYPTHGRTVTVRRLLNHTSGIPGYTEMPGFETIRRRSLPRDTLVAMFGAEPFMFEPGTAQIYSNSGYFLAGLIVAQASGRSYEEYVEQEIFGKLGMRHSAYCSNIRVLRNKVVGYALGPTGITQGGYLDHTWPYAAGSLCSSAGDLITWLRALHHGGVLTPAMYREMTSPASLADGSTLRYGMGLYVGTDATGHHALSHGGGIDGYLSSARYYPDADLYVVVLQNTIGPTGPSATANALVERVLGQLPEAPAVTLRNPDQYVGAYRGPTRLRRDDVAHIAREGAALTLRMNDEPAALLRPVGIDTFQVGNRVLVFKWHDGRITELRIDQGTGHSVMRRD